MDESLIVNGLTLLQEEVNRSIANLHNAPDLPRQVDLFPERAATNQYIERLGKLCAAEGAIVRAYAQYKQMRMDVERHEQREQLNNSDNTQLIIERRIVYPDDRQNDLNL